MTASANITVCPSEDGTAIRKPIWSGRYVHSSCISVPDSMQSILSGVRYEFQYICGSTVCEKSQIQKDAIILAEENAQITNLRQKMIDRINDDLLIRAQLEVDYEKEVLLRDKLGLPTITKSEYIDRLVAKINTLLP